MTHFSIRYSLGLSLLCVGLLIGLGGQSVVPVASAEAGKVITTKSGLKYEDKKVGSGTVAEKGKLVFVHYTGWLNENGAQGKQFDSSRGRDVFKFPLGGGMVIAGWEEGVEGMKVGGQRTLMIPPELGYGARGAGGVIPPQAHLIFDIELLDVK
jgi:FKBP-type peptidyl-prolyl cis-trans isomerase